MRIRLGKPMNDPVEYTPVAVRMWYDRHLRLWTLYPVDKDGNQTQDAQYAPNREDAEKIKMDMEAALGLSTMAIRIQTIKNWYQYGNCDMLTAIQQIIDLYNTGEISSTDAEKAIRQISRIKLNG